MTGPARDASLPPARGRLWAAAGRRPPASGVSAVFVDPAWGDPVYPTAVLAAPAPRRSAPPPRTWWPAALAGGVVAVAAAALLATPSDVLVSATPAQVTAEFYESGRTGDTAATARVLCASDNSRDRSHEVFASGPVLDYRITAVTVRGGRALVAAAVTVAGGDPQPASVPLVRERGAWKVCYTADPGGAG